MLHFPCGGAAGWLNTYWQILPQLSAEGVPAELHAFINLLFWDPTNEKGLFFLTEK